MSSKYLKLFAILLIGLAVSGVQAVQVKGENGVATVRVLKYSMNGGTVEVCRDFIDLDNPLPMPEPIETLPLLPAGNSDEPISSPVNPGSNCMIEVSGEEVPVYYGASLYRFQHDLLGVQVTQVSSYISVYGLDGLININDNQAVNSRREDVSGTVFDHFLNIQDPNCGVEDPVPPTDPRPNPEHEGGDNDIGYPGPCDFSSYRVLVEFTN